MAGDADALSEAARRGAANTPPLERNGRQERGLAEGDALHPVLQVASEAGPVGAIFPRASAADAEAYLAMRGNPDPFDERPNAPPRPLAASTLHQQREHIRLAASVLIEGGIPRADITSLADLVEPERFKMVLRHYMGANGQPNAFVICMAKTLDRDRLLSRRAQMPSTLPGSRHLPASFHPSHST